MPQYEMLMDMQTIMMIMSAVNIIISIYAVRGVANLKIR